MQTILYRPLARAAFASLAFAAACAADDDLDGADDTFITDGKTDVAGIAEGSTDACGVVKLANEASLEVLDDDVALDRRAAKNIVAARPFRNLTALDAVKYVGPKAFTKLLAFAQEQGWSCEYPAVELQLLTVSDWHGQLDPVSVNGVGNVGGAAALSTWFQQDRAANPNTLTLTAGDAFGASPPLAAFFDERPAVLAMNAMAFSADGLGNHNFDRGTEHLAATLDLATYPILSANLENAESLVCPSKPAGRCVEPFHIFDVGGVKVAVIGVINGDAEGLVKPGSFGATSVGDPIFGALEARAKAKKAGAELFVAIVHMGATGVDAAGAPVGPLIDFANGVAGFDVIVGDHTNVPVNAVVNGALVVENKSTGLTYARIRVSVSSATGRPLSPATAELVTPLADAVTPDPAIVALLAPYRVELTAAFDGKVAVTTGLYERGANVERLREMPIGDLLADALRVTYGTQLGFTNGGGIRAPLPSSYAPADLTLRRNAAGYAAGPPWDLVVGDFYTVLPFGNAVVTRTVTGAQLWAMMEHAVEALPLANGWFGQISGFRVTFDSSKPAGSRVVEITFDDGTPIPADETRYTMATSDFIDVGGDGYSMLANGDGVSRDKMAQVFLDYVKGLGTITPAIDGRLTDIASTP